MLPQLSLSLDTWIVTVGHCRKSSANNLFHRHIDVIVDIFQFLKILFNVLQAPEWTEEDLSQLTRSMVKFPGGTPGRWDKIAHELGRSVTDVSSLKFALSGE
jgi:hypothetical protein